LSIRHLAPNWLKIEGVAKPQMFKDLFALADLFDTTLMPGMDGFELCRHCKTDEQLRHIPFIFYSAHYTDPKDEQFAFSLGADQYITKPQQPELLVQIVREVLAEQVAKTDSTVFVLGETGTGKDKAGYLLLEELQVPKN